MARNSCKTCVLLCVLCRGFCCTIALQDMCVCLFNNCASVMFMQLLAFRMSRAPERSLLRQSFAFRAGTRAVRAGGFFPPRPECMLGAQLLLSFTLRASRSLRASVGRTLTLRRLPSTASDLMQRLARALRPAFPRVPLSHHGPGPLLLSGELRGIDRVATLGFGRGVRWVAELYPGRVV